MKTLKIDDDTHLKLKVYCAKNKLKISKWVDKVIKFVITHNIELGSYEK